MGPRRVRHSDLDIENDIAVYNTRLEPEHPARLQVRPTVRQLVLDRFKLRR